MRKHNTVGKSSVTRKRANRKLTVGIDLGDRSSRYCLLDEQGSCGTGQVCEELAESLSAPLKNALQPLLAEVESVSAHIREYDEQIENIGKSRYPEIGLLKQVHG
jgi:hypothetical protein